MTRFEKHTTTIFGAGWGIGAPNPTCGTGPQALRAAGVVETLRPLRGGVRWGSTVTTDGAADVVESIGRACAELADEVAHSIAAGEFPLVLGGDHSCAIGTWHGVARGMGDTDALGLIWIDAHLDSHVPATSPSQAIHGMPLACLLGFGAPALTSGARPLRPEHVCIVGAHSFEPAEAALLTRLGVRIFPLAEIRHRGLKAVLAEALQRVQTGTAGFGITLDVDAIDPLDAPGVGVPEPGGLHADELIDALHGLAGDPLLKALEIVEYDPARDVEQRTERCVLRLLQSIFAPAPDAGRLRALELRYGARNYDPLPVVLSRGRGAWVWDVEGRRYLDMMSAYSAVSLGHAHPRIVAALAQQAHTLAVTSRAYHNDRLPLFLQRLCELTGYDQALPVNTGLEAVETALKVARKWGYRIKGIAESKAEIIACDGNFHGRSIAIVGLSSEPQYRDGFGPFPAGLKRVPYGDAAALRAAITPNTAAFLVEPIQGEAGIVIPPPGYLAECARICRQHDVLLICDEVQTGLGRTGRLLASQHDGVRPDGVILGKALGGGILPVSAFLADRGIMGVIEPGDHGSTFGGNPLAASVAMETLAVIVDEGLVERSAELGERLLEALRELPRPLVRDVRGRGLFVGVEIDPAYGNARDLCRQLLANGILSKDTHDTVLRFAPPLVISRADVDRAIRLIRRTFAAARRRSPQPA